MRQAVRKHLRDFIALLCLFVVGLGVAGYILSNQRFYLPNWVPVAGTDFYTVEAELSTAQAVVPGQGQTVNIAGVKIGDIGKVELEDGHAVVEMKIQRKYAPIYKDTKLLLRPKTGLKDMYLAMTPGTAAAGELKDCNDTDEKAECRIPVANTIPDVNPDEVLSSLDRDTRDYLTVLANAGGDAFDDKQAKEEGAFVGKAGEEQSAAVDLRETLKRFEPTGRDTVALTKEVAERRRNLKRLVHNFQLLSTELARRDDQLSAFVSSSNDNFEAIAQQDQRLREALRLFPDALQTTQNTLASADELAQELGPDAPGDPACGPCARPDAAPGAPVRARDHADHQGRDPPVRARRARAGARTAPHGRPAGRGHAAAHPHLQGHQLPAQHLHLQPEGQRGGLPLLGVVGQPHGRVDLRHPGRPRRHPPRPLPHQLLEPHGAGADRQDQPQPPGADRPAERAAPVRRLPEADARDARCADVRQQAASSKQAGNGRATQRQQRQRR